MNLRNVLVTAAFAAFLVLSTVATVQHGYIAIFEVGLRDTAAAQVFCDLCFALFLTSRWLYGDAKKRGVNPWPWLVATPFLGSIAPVTYFLWREWSAAEDMLAEPSVAAK